MPNLPQKIKTDLPFLPFFIDEVEETRLFLLEREKKLKRWTGVLLPLMVAGLQVPNWSWLSFAFSDYIAIGLIISIVPVYIYLLLQIKKLQKEYKTLFEDNIYGYITESKNPNWSLQKGKIEFDEVDKKAAGIFEGFIRLLKKTYQIQGFFANHTVKVIGVHVAFRNQRRGSDNFKGLLLRITLPKQLLTQIIITPSQAYQQTQVTGTNVLALHQQNFEPHDGLDNQFSKYFKVYSTRNDIQILTPTLQRQLAHFISHRKNQLHLYFTGNHLYITIRTNPVSIKPVIHKPKLIEEAVKSHHEEMSIVIDLLKRLEQGGLFELPTSR